MAELGYLRFDIESKCYLPNDDLGSAVSWIPKKESMGRIERIAENIFAGAGETTSVTRQQHIFMTQIFVREATHAFAVKLAPSIIPSFSAGIS